MRRHMRVGMKVRVWRKDTTYYGISHFMMKERTLNVGLVRDAKVGLSILPVTPLSGFAPTGMRDLRSLLLFVFRPQLYGTLPWLFVR